ncbi:MAG TPA: primase-like DNA-binding domain-containing protein, partial [Phycisphaerales bacterium]|nr:primase-like DNA-binding domain-containing protein [Phycisphaerales bacterium]
MKLAASPVAIFLSERCSRVPESRVLFDDLHRAYKTWASQEHLDGTLSPQEFGRELNSALPGKKLKRTTGGM